MQGCLEEEDMVALRKLRKDDASGALKEYFGDSEDPREWKSAGASAVTKRECRLRWSAQTQRVPACTKLTALRSRSAIWPLTTQPQCSSLVELPAASATQALTDSTVRCEPPRSTGSSS